jgi:hypothetical protein
MASCSACKENISPGAPWLKYRDIVLYSGCYINLIPRIYKMNGAGDGGLITVLFEECVKMTHNIKYKKNFINISKLDERIAKVFKPFIEDSSD